MKITKGRKLTRQQKAQRAEIRNCRPDVLGTVQKLRDDLARVESCLPRFSVVERRALEWFGAKYKLREATPHQLAHWILQHVLANPASVCAAIDSFHRYRDAEGFNGRGNELADSRIARCPEYK